MNRLSKSYRRGLGAIFGIPLLIGLASGIGLLAALLTDGPPDLLWSLAVAAPIVMVMGALCRR